MEVQVKTKDLKPGDRMLLGEKEVTVRKLLPGEGGYFVILFESGRYYPAVPDYLWLVTRGPQKVHWSQAKDRIVLDPSSLAKVKVFHVFRADGPLVVCGRLVELDEQRYWFVAISESLELAE